MSVYFNSKNSVDSEQLINNTLKNNERKHHLNVLAKKLDVEIEITEISPASIEVVDATLFENNPFVILNLKKLEDVDPVIVVLLLVNAFEHLDSENERLLLRKVIFFYKFLKGREQLQGLLNALIFKMAAIKELSIHVLIQIRVIEISDIDALFNILIQCYKKLNNFSKEDIYRSAGQLSLSPNQRVDLYSKLYKELSLGVPPREVSFLPRSPLLLGKLYCDYFDSQKDTLRGDILQVSKFPFKDFLRYLYGELTPADIRNPLVDWACSIDAFAPKQYCNKKHFSEITRSEAPLVGKIENRQKSIRLKRIISEQKNNKALCKRKIIQCYATALLPPHLPILLMSSVVTDGNGDYSNHLQVAKLLLDDPANFDIHSKLFFSPGREKILQSTPPPINPRFHSNFSIDGQDITNNNPLDFSPMAEFEKEPFDPINFVENIVQKFHLTISSASFFSKKGYQFIPSLKTSPLRFRKIEPFKEEKMGIETIKPKVIIEVSYRSFDNAISKEAQALYPEAGYGFIREFAWTKGGKGIAFKTGPFIGGALFFNKQLLENSSNPVRAKQHAWDNLTIEIKKLIFGDCDYEEFTKNNDLHVGYFRHHLTAHTFLYTLCALYKDQRESLTCVVKCNLEIFNFEFVKSLGYTTIVYLSQRENKTIKLSDGEEKILRILDILPVMQEDLFRMMTLSNPIVGCTGDGSFTEVLSLGMLPFYEVTEFKWINYLPQAFEELIEKHFPDSPQLLEYYKTMFRLTRRANKSSLYAAIKPGVLEKGALQLSQLLENFPFQDQIALREDLLQECSSNDYIKGIVRKLLFNKIDFGTKILEKQIFESVKQGQDAEPLFDQLKAKIEMISEELKRTSDEKK